MLAADPADAQSVQQLAAMLYMLGQWQLEAGLRTEAVSSLDGAEGLYERLGDHAAHLVAGVVILPASLRAQLWGPLCALGDASQAGRASPKWVPQEPRSPHP